MADSLKSQIPISGISPQTPQRKDPLLPHVKGFWIGSSMGCWGVKHVERIPVVTVKLLGVEHPNACAFLVGVLPWDKSSSLKQPPIPPEKVFGRPTHTYNTFSGIWMSRKPL